MKYPEMLETGTQGCCSQYGAKRYPCQDCGNGLRSLDRGSYETNLIPDPAQLQTGFVFLCGFLSDGYGRKPSS